MMFADLIPQLVRVTELAAIACYPTIGKGDRKYADKVATEAMRKAFNEIPIDGTVVIGEGERDEAPMLFIGEKVGSGQGPKVDIAVDPLEGTNLCAEGLPDAICVFAITTAGGFTHGPDMYMDKLCVGPKAAGKVHLGMSPKEIVDALAMAHGVSPSEITIAVLERDRHAERIAGIKAAGAKLHIFTDGDVLQGIRTCIPEQNIHALWNIGASAEGVLKAAAMRSMGGAIEAKFYPKDDAERARLISMGTNPEKIYMTEDLAKGENVVFIASGVTSGAVVEGVTALNGKMTVHTLVMQSYDKSVQYFKGEYPIS